MQHACIIPRGRTIGLEHHAWRHGYLLREVAAARPPTPVLEGVIPASVSQAPEAGVEEWAVLRVISRHTGIGVPHPSPVRVVTFVAAGATVLRAALAADDRR